MKLSTWAKKQGISYRTAWRWFKQGALPDGVRMEQAPTGTVIVTETINTPVSTPNIMTVGLYARVSSSDQNKDLDAQLGRLTAYAGTSRMDHQ